MRRNLQLLRARKLFEQASPQLVAFGDIQRQHIVLLLCENGPMSVSQITAGSQLSRPAISHHLKILQDANLVRVTRIGTRHEYALHLREGTECLNELLKVMSDFWKGEGR
ncbi:MAG TPA: metalloregulator ArsR/SmtB family transcription factor [Verrucomicrobiae bacterium]|nr:metalloregulator ArsR/SmtB family transcription factor [Verrucomicrobiae bacterium]